MLRRKQRRKKGTMMMRTPRRKVQTQITTELDVLTWTPHVNTLKMKLLSFTNVIRSNGTTWGTTASPHLQRYLQYKYKWLACYSIKSLAGFPCPSSSSICHKLHCSILLVVNYRSTSERNSVCTPSALRLHLPHLAGHQNNHLANIAAALLHLILQRLYRSIGKPSLLTFSCTVRC